MQPTNEPPRRQTFWTRRVSGPLQALLVQGMSPDGISRTLAWCVVCSLFPVLGATSVINLMVGHWRRLNHVLMQTLNQLAAPLHLAMIVVYVRAGEWLCGAGEGERITVESLATAFGELDLLDFARRFGRAGMHALVAWAVTAPLLYWMIRWLALPVLRRMAAAREV